MRERIRMLQSKPVGERGAELDVGTDIEAGRARDLVALGWAEYVAAPDRKQNANAPVDRRAAKGEQR